MAGEIQNMSTWELSVPNNGGRAEVDPNVLRDFNLALSESVANQIRALEETVVTAEQRLGTFLVG